MKSSTKPATGKALATLETNWGAVEQGLGVDLDASARTHNALRRAREVKSGRDLLRLGLAARDRGAEWTGRAPADEPDG